MTKKELKESFRDSEGKVIQNLPDHLIHSDLEYLEVVGTPKLFRRAIQYLKKNTPKLNVSLHDLLDMIGLKAGKHSDELIYQAEIWAKASPEIREQYKLEPSITPEKIVIFEEIINDDYQKGQSLLDLVLKLAELWGDSNSNDKDTLEAMKIISESTGIDIDKLESTDYTISAELFTRIIFKPKEAWKQCFFLGKATAKLQKIFSL